jgi:hypothetical protein
MNELDWKQPALIGGLIAGFLSVIPGISFGNCCFCAWLLVGGAVAAKMLISRTPRPVKSGEGALIGAVAGLIAAGVYLAINIPVVIFAIGERFQQALFERLGELNSNPDIQELMRKGAEAIAMNANLSPAQRLVSALPLWIVSSLLFVGFSTLGGLLGVALFEKRENQPPPPQYPSGYPPQHPPGQYPPGQYPPQYPPNNPQQGPSDYPPQNPPQSGGSGGDQGGWPQG